MTMKAMMAEFIGTSLAFANAQHRCSPGWGLSLPF